MRCEPWMDRTPVPRKTPLQLAEADLDLWSDRCRSLIEQLAAAERQRTMALARIKQLEA